MGVWATAQVASVGNRGGQRGRSPRPSPRLRPQGEDSGEQGQNPDERHRPSNNDNCVDKNKKTFLVTQVKLQEICHLLLSESSFMSFIVKNSKTRDGDGS